MCEKMWSVHGYLDLPVLHRLPCVWSASQQAAADVISLRRALQIATRQRDDTQTALDACAHELACERDAHAALARDLDAAMSDIARVTEQCADGERALADESERVRAVTTQWEAAVALVEGWTAQHAEAQRHARAMEAEIDRIYDELGGAVDVRFRVFLLLSLSLSRTPLMRASSDCAVYLLYFRPLKLVFTKIHSRSSSSLYVYLGNSPRVVHTRASVPRHRPDRGHTRRPRVRAHRRIERTRRRRARCGPRDETEVGAWSQRGGCSQLIPISSQFS